MEDRHLPTVIMDNFIRRLVSPPQKKLSRFIRAGIIAADVGCGPGYFTIPMAKLTGSSGHIYAVDSDRKAIDSLQAKLTARGLQNIIEAHAASAADMRFVPNGSVDFVLANGTLCCMTDHRGAVEEIRRILKPAGFVYLSVSKFYRKGDPRAVTERKWNEILTHFRVKERGGGLTNRWAVISLEPNTVT